MSQYEPPGTISPKIVGLVEEIGEALGRITERGGSDKALRLRRLDRVRTIQGSLAIEGNELTVDQITALMDGKRVVAAASDILEAKNAIRVYDSFDDWNPKSEEDLLAAHRALMDGLDDEAGRYRSGGVGVVSGEDVVHVAPPADRVPQLMNDLFSWTEKTNQHPLIASSIFHYELEFIHPFSDGNGRMGRLWQSLLLSEWNPIFGSLPVESLIHANQERYYRAIHQSTNGADSRPFVEFLLSVLLKTLTDAPQVTPQVQRLLDALGTDERSRTELQEALGLSDPKSFRERYLVPALEGGWIEPTIPDKPQSPKQRYRRGTGEE